MNGGTTEFFVTGGTVPLDALSYVPRRADEELLAALPQGKFCYLLTSRQVGKSSLIARTTAALRELGFRAAAVDLTLIGRDMAPVQWYKGILSVIGERLGIEDELSASWAELRELPPVSRFLGVLEGLISAPDSAPLILFIDEIDATRSLPFDTDEFFAAIRACHNRRAEDPHFRRLCFCLAGVAAPTDLIKDPRCTPFNVGQSIELTDFSREEANRLAAGFAARGVTGRPCSPHQARQVLGRILHWTGGHPYLTQRLCQAVCDHPGAIGPRVVDRICAGLFLNDRRRGKDSNLHFVQRELLESGIDPARAEETRTAVVDLYARVLRQQRVPDDEKDARVQRLRLAGLVRSEAGYLRVRNRIYARAYDLPWVEEQMPGAEVRRQHAAYLLARRRTLAQAGAVGIALLAFSGIAWESAQQAYQARLRSDRMAARLQATVREDRALTVAQRTWAAWRAYDAGDLEDAERHLEAVELLDGGGEGRGWWWNYISGRIRGNEGTLGFTNAFVKRVAPLPDGRHLVEVDGKHLILIRDRATGTVVQRLEPPLASPGTIHVWGDPDLSPDGTAVAVCRQIGPRFDPSLQPGTLKLDGEWEVFWRRLQDPGWQGPVRWRGLVHALPRSLSVSPRAEYIAALGGSQERPTVLLLNTRTGTTQRSSGERDEFPTHVEWSPDGTTLAVGTEGGAVRLVDTRSGSLRVLRGAGHARVHRLAFDGAGRVLAVRDAEGDIRVWDLGQERLRAELSGGEASDALLALSPNGRLLACAMTVGPAVSHAGLLRFWNLTGNSPSRSETYASGTVSAFGFDPDGKHVITAGSDRTLRVWSSPEDPSTGWPRRLTGGGRLAPAPDGLHLAVRSFDRVDIWRRGKEQPERVLSAPGGGSIAYAPSGRMLAAADLHDLRVWNPATGELLLRAHHPGTVSGAAFSPRTELLYSASVDGTIRAWDVARRRESFSFRIDGKPLTGLCFEPEGRTLLVTSEHGELWRCEADSGSRRGPAKLLAKVPGPAGDPKLAPGGRFVAWGTAETLTIRDLQLGHEVALGSRGRANRHASWVFAPDGRTLVVSTPNLGIRFFDTATGVDVGQIGTPKDRFGSLAFSADGRELLSSGDRAALHRWVADQPSAGTPANRGRSSRD